MTSVPIPAPETCPAAWCFAGNKWGDASAGVRYPENLWHGAFAPRIGFAYRLNDKTVIRSGYGLFYTQAFYPGWGGGINLDGFNPLVNFGNSLSGYQPSFYLDNGFPAYSTASNISLPPTTAPMVPTTVPRMPITFRIPNSGT